MTGHVHAAQASASLGLALFSRSCIARAAQDPERRPSSRDLLAHEFVAGACAPPPALLERIRAFSATRQPVAPGAAVPEAHLPAPKWNFGTSGLPDSSQKSVGFALRFWLSLLEFT